jgi:hypothetical protein
MQLPYCKHTETSHGMRTGKRRIWKNSAVMRPNARKKEHFHISCPDDENVPSASGFWPTGKVWL